MTEWPSGRVIGETSIRTMSPFWMGLLRSVVARNMRSTKATSPLGSKVGIIDGPTQMVNSAMCSRTRYAAATYFTRVARWADAALLVATAMEGDDDDDDLRTTSFRPTFVVVCLRLRIGLCLGLHQRLPCPGGVVGVSHARDGKTIETSSVTCGTSQTPFTGHRFTGA